MLTEMEKAVYRHIVVESFYDIGAEAREIAEALDIDIKKLRGVISSLIKKDLISVYQFENGETREKVTVFGPLDDDDNYAGFGCDLYSEERYCMMFFGVNSFAALAKVGI